MDTTSVLIPTEIATAFGINLVYLAFGIPFMFTFIAFCKKRFEKWTWLPTLDGGTVMILSVVLCGAYAFACATTWTGRLISFGALVAGSGGLFDGIKAAKNGTA